MFADTMRWAWAEIDLGRIASNMRAVRAKAGGRQVMGVVKADAYGHGAAAVSRVLLENGADSLAVATLDEAAALRDAGFDCPVLVLGPTPDECCGALMEYGLTPVTAVCENAAAISRAAAAAGVEKGLFVAVDTGMGRIGVPADASGARELARIASLPNIRLEGVFSHFATADERDKSYAMEQISLFDRFCGMIEAMGLKPGVRTFANSAALMGIPSALYDAVRPGIALYGCYPSGDVSRDSLALAPAMSVKARITHIKRVPPGTSISYGRKFTAERESVIATLPLGYANGLPRFISGKGRVIARGEYAPLVGTVCMDQCMADVTGIAGVERGDEVVVMGADGGREIRAEEIGKKTGTISYEALCGFGRCLPRVYRGPG
ncbi:MAG: alanine racemase [Clostridiales Family XIII bacterium]|jgi:alanine racemase|nr:alanine racemase [Clostridiales Family XIII bacterium]